MKALASALALALAASFVLAAPPSPGAGGEAALPPPAIASARPAARGYAPVNGLRLYYEVHGPEGGTPIVLLHGGNPAIETSWERILPALARTHRVIAFDQQGHGRTADVDRPFTFEGSADDTAALLAFLTVSKANLMGFSNGANIAMQVAIRHPQVVRRLVVASGMVKRDGLRPEFWSGMQNAKLEDMPPHFVDVYRKTSPHPDRLPSFFRKSVESDARVSRLAEATVRIHRGPDAGGDRGRGRRPPRARGRAGAGPAPARLAVLPLTDHQAVVEAHAGWLIPMVEAFLGDDVPSP